MTFESDDPQVGQTMRGELRPGVLFVCVHNTGRSQMAAGFLKEFLGDSVRVLSAGSEPSDEVSSLVVTAMAEKGIDIRDAVPKRLRDDLVKEADLVVTMGCGDACPVLPGKRYLDWEVDDPSGLTLKGVRTVRDDLEHRARALTGEIGLD